MTDCHREKVPVETSSQGLDRAALNVYDNAERHIVAKLEASGQAGSIDNHESISSDTEAPHSLSKTSRKIRTKIKEKAKGLAHPTHKDHTPSGPPTAPCLAPLPSKSTDDDRLYNALPEHKGPQAKDFIRSPISTVQSALHGASGAKFAEVADNQVIAHGANVGLVRAWDNLSGAQSEKEKEIAIDEVEALKKERQDSYVRWTVDRHVLKVRQAPPRVLEWPRKEDYRVKDNEGKMVLQWGAYGRQVRYILLFPALWPLHPCNILYGL